MPDSAFDEVLVFFNLQLTIYNLQLMSKYFLLKNLQRDIPASIVVFLVALPLCLGIALASGAPLFAGIITGILGGIITASISGSQLSVSGPAAGLTVIVLTSIATLGSFPLFLAAVVLAGIFQIILGLVKAGTIGNYFPSSVIEGMLAAIGVILILKQIPHAVGYDKDYQGDFDFFQLDHENTISSLFSAFEFLNFGAVIISVLSVLILIFWPKFKKLSVVPSALLVVVIGIILGQVFNGTSLALQADQRVQIPIVQSAAEFFGLFVSPDFSQLFTNKQVWTVAFTIAVVASLETLLSLEAVDKLDPIKRVSPTNRELIAQGIGNTISGLLGGLPMTSVIVRSSANVGAGARTKMSSIFHGLWLLVALVFIPNVINYIPLSALAAILLMTGYKLAKPSLIKKMWHLGWDQFIPFMVTVLAGVFTDLLIGVGIGMAVGVLYILRTNMRNPFFFKLDKSAGLDKVYRLELAQEVSFLNKGAVQYAFTHIPENSTVIIDGSNARYIDHDVLEIIHNFQENAFTKNIKVNLIEIKDKYEIAKFTI